MARTERNHKDVCAHAGGNVLGAILIVFKMQCGSIRQLKPKVTNFQKPHLPDEDLDETKRVSVWACWNVLGSGCRSSSSSTDGIFTVPQN